MKELFDLIYTVLFIPIPLPISFFGVTMYYNLFGFFVVCLLFLIISLVIRKTSGGASD